MAVGAYYLDQEAKFSQFVPDYSCPACLVTVARGQDFELDAPLAKFSDEEQKSIFAQVSYDLTEQWTVGVGGRYLEDDLTEPRFAADGFLVRGPTGPRDSGPPNSGKYDEINPSAYVRYEPSDEHHAVRAGLARVSAAAVVNQLLADHCQEEAEALGAQDVHRSGHAVELRGRREVAARRRPRGASMRAVYRQKWEGVQLGVTLDCGFCNGFNAGDATSDGVELELVAQPVDAWRFNFAVSVQQHRVRQRRTRHSSFVAGERLPEVPELNGSAGVQYNFSLGSTWSGFFRADYVYVGDVRAEVPGAGSGRRRVVTQDAYDKANRAPVVPARTARARPVRQQPLRRARHREHRAAVVRQPREHRAAARDRRRAALFLLTTRTRGIE